MQIQMVTFSAAKDGNAPGEWQDGACGGVIPDGTGAPHRARFVVLDGATTAYDPVRWVDQLVRSFAPQPDGSSVTFWAACIDLGKRYSGSVAGVMNTFGNLAGASSPVVTAYVASRFGWTSALTLAAMVTVGSGVCWFGVDTRQGPTEITS